MTRLRWVRWVVAAVLLATVAGCTGVPGSSDPQVVRTVGLGEVPPPSAPAPPVGASQRSIVQGFVDAMESSPDRLDAARAYLDEDAVQKWSGASVTIVRQSSFVVGSEVQGRNQVPITYEPVGALAADGVYTPVLAGQGYAPVRASTYSLAKNPAGEWRIRNPVPTGLFITDVDFRLLFAPKALYFLDVAGTRLVPDLRYSPLTEPSLESYLLAQLVAGPRADLDAAVSPFEPAPTGNQRPNVTPGTPTVVQVPGSAALDGPTRVRLAAQLAFTLRPSSFQSDLQIRDGTETVQVPGVGDTFDFRNFPDLAPVDVTDAATATYIRGGAVVGADGKALPGKLGTGTYGLDSAVFDSDGGRTLTAATAGPEGQRRLLVGDSAALADAGVPAGPLTPPVWAPVGTSSDTDEVWVASRGVIYRFVPGAVGAVGAHPAIVPLSGQNTPVTGTITSMSFSPEGSRLALVIAGPGSATSQLWVAAVVRNPDVQLAQLEQVTPAGVDIADAGWRNDTLLAAVGTVPGDSNFPTGVYLEVAVDGSRLSLFSPDGLPEPPRTIAVSPRATSQWVTVGTGAEATVFTRPTSTGPWAPPADVPSQSGSAPAFSD